MKKVKYYLLFIIIFMVFLGIKINRVSAEELKCNYKWHNSGMNTDDTIELTFNFDEDKITNTNPGTYWFDSNDGPKDRLFEGYEKYTEEYFVNIVKRKKKCPDKIFSVELSSPSNNSRKHIYVFNQDVLSNFEVITTSNVKYCTLKGLDGFIIPYSNCENGSANHNRWEYVEAGSDAKSFPLPFSCPKYTEYWSKKDFGIEKISKKYEKKCSDHERRQSNDCKEIYEMYTDKLTKLRQYCQSIMNYRDYESACVDKCINLNTELSQLYIVTGQVDPSDCNMSDTIISIVYNVLKWMKYIAPVLVIILSMIDFIKALASQDNDAMKKAQQKFVKRLVSAVILFLLPLIIDYVLRLFNLVDTKCDITNIFK